jgi:hypothetical protein
MFTRARVSGLGAGGRPARFSSVHCLCLALLLAAGPGAAVAATSSGSLVFREPEGMVLPGDAIPVWLRFELQGELPAIIGRHDDASLLDARYLPTMLTAFDDAWQAIESFGREDPGVAFHATGAQLNVSFLCAETFTAGCGGGPPYAFAFDFGPSSVFGFANDFNLQPAQPVDFLFGTFTPTEGSAPFGRYHFYGASLFLDVSGTATRTREEPLFHRRAAGEFVLDDLGEPIPLFERDEFGELVLDGSGNPIPLVERDEFGDPVLDEFGNPIPLFERYSGGELVLDDFGDPIPLYERDADGNLVLDEFGHPIPLVETTTVTFAHVRGNTDIGLTPCWSGPYDPSCAGNFSREVVPLPAAGWLFVSALGGALVAARRRTRVTTT